MENKMLRPPSGNFDMVSLGGTSRKRKLTAMDQAGAKSDSIFEHCISRESNVRKANLLAVTQVEENTRGSCLNQTNSVEPFRHQYEKDQFYHKNIYSGSLQGSKGNFLTDGIEKLSNSSLHLPQSLGYKRSIDSLNKQVGDSVVLSNWQPQTPCILGPNGAYTSLPFSKSYDAHAGKSQVTSHYEEARNFGSKNLVMEKMSAGMCNTSSKGLRPVDILQESFLKADKFSNDMGGRTHSQEDNKPGISCELRQSSHSSNNEGITDLPTIGVASLDSSFCTEHNQNRKRLLQNDVQFGSRSLVVHLGDISEIEKQGYEDDAGKIKENTEASYMKNLKHPLSEELSPKNASLPNNVEHGQKNNVEHGQKNDLPCGFLRSDEKSKSHLGKVVPIVAEKLWEGSLQLSSSVSVSAVAFFKSGEKLHDTNWCESVEVKGKVRLEAFEKYIQDLPRSRNRGLMVISLCWKEGSSETGLTGMKEVARGYKKGERVGFAQLSQGIDLYICPRSEAIITILAKYGFFKGMAAVEDNKDSMIGCVVWRKNRTTSSNSVGKKPESKSNSLSVQPLNSPSNSPIKHTAEKSLPVTQTAQESLAPALVTDSSIIEGAGKSGCESKNIKSSKIHIENASSSSFTNAILTISVPGVSSTIAGIQNPVGSNSASFQLPQGDLLKVEAPSTCCSGPELPKASLNFQEPVMPFPSIVLKETMASLDDDDLPEYDFTIALGISQTGMRKPSDTMMLDKRLPVLPGASNLLPVSVRSQRSDNSTPPKVHLTTNEGMPPLKTFTDRESQTPVFGRMDESPSGQRLDRSMLPKVHLEGIPQLKTFPDCESQAPVFPRMEERPGDQRSNHLMLSKVRLTANEGMPLKTFLDHESRTPVFTRMEERPNVQNKVLTSLVSAPVFTLPKNLFDDDDDDMPEWCPPELRKQPLAETARPSTIMPPEIQPRHPVLPSPSPAVTRPSFSSQAFPPTFHRPPFEAQQPRLLVRGLRPSMPFNYDSVLGTPPSFDIKPPFHPADKRVRRP